MNEEVVLSVIIPTYKPGDYFFKCLDSIGMQTLNEKEFEVIIVLNGCNEPWYSKINQWTKDAGIYSALKFIQTDQPGVSNARNMGLEIALGRFIAFIDDDDYVSPSYFEALLRCSSETCVGLSDCAYFIDGNSNLNFNNQQHKLYLRNLKVKCPSILSTRSYFNGPCMKIIHRNIIANRRFDVRFKNGEDSLFMILISEKIKCVKLAPKDAIYYRRIRTNSAATTYRSFNQKLMNMLKMQKQISIYWYKHLFRYNPFFMLSRYIACIKGLLK